MLCRNFFLIPGSKSYVYASNKQYLTDDGILTKAWDYMDFIDENTAWGKKRQAVNTSMRRRASMIVTDNFGNKIEVGYKSEIIGVSLKDNPDAVRGKAGMLILCYNNHILYALHCSTYNLVVFLLSFQI